MSVNGINQANGADLLQLYAQSTGGSAAVAMSASMKALKTAIAEAQISEAAILGGDSGSSTGNNLNLFA